MPRTADKGRKAFHWLPRDASVILSWAIEINGTDVTTDVIGSEFEWVVCPETGLFNVKLINAGGEYSGVFSQGQFVELKMDFASGTTQRFKGKIDKIVDRYGTSYDLVVSGGHLAKDLMDVTVTESYSGSNTITEIIEDIISKYLTGYTSSVTATSTKTPTINWDEKPFWDCINDLTKVATADAYLSNSKVITFFDKSSVENNDEAVVWNDTMIELDGLGVQTITTKNKVVVYGKDDAGLPIINTSNDADSQTNYGVKKRVIFDSKVTTGSEANEVGDAELADSANPEIEGEASCLILPSLVPGDKIWVTNPPIGITAQYRVYKFIHKLPQEQTQVVFGTERKVHQIFKKRVENELKSQTVTNPHKMTSSLNFTYDDEGDIASKDSNVSVSNGKITLASGSQGVITHTTYTLSAVITAVHLMAVGNNLVGTDFELSTDGGSTYETLSLNNKTTLSDSGDSVVLKVTIQSANTEIDSVAVLYK